MRKFAFVLPLLGVALSACAAPPIRLSTRYETGDTRVYRLNADATTTVAIGDERRVERTTLVARSTLEVLGVRGDETTVRVTVAPERFLRDGRSTQAPPEQRAELILGPDGTVRRVASVGGLAPELAGADAQDVVPLLGARLPGRRVHLGDRWANPGPGRERGRVAALRAVRGYECAVLSLGAQRPIVRERTIAGQSVRLAGTEIRATEIAFAFREGFPVDLRTTAEAEFAVETGGFSGGAVTINTRTRLELVRAGA